MDATVSRSDWLMPSVKLIFHFSAQVNGFIQPFQYACALLIIRPINRNAVRNLTGKYAPPVLQLPPKCARESRSVKASRVYADCGVIVSHYKLLISFASARPRLFIATNPLKELDADKFDPQFCNELWYCCELCATDKLPR
jgi:hypothetical protein